MENTQSYLKRSFQRQCADASIRLNFTTQSKLIIDVFDPIRIKSYEQQIDQPFIDRQKEFQNILETPFEVYDCLTHGQSEIVIEKDEITFAYTYSASSLKKKIFTIKLIQVEMGSAWEDQLKVKKLQEYIARKLLQYSTQIIIMREQIKQQQSVQIKKQFNKIKMEIKQQNSDYKLKDKISQQLKQMKQILQQQKNNNKLIDQKLYDLSQTVSALKKENSETIKFLLNSVKELSKSTFISDIGTEQTSTIAHHPDNPYQRYFKLTDQPNGGKIIKFLGKGSQYYNYVNRIGILPRQSAKYKIKILNHNYFYVGFCTSAGLGKTQNFQSLQAAYFYNRGGYLYEGGGEAQSIKLSTSDGDVIQCEADHAQGYFRWWNNGRKIFETKMMPEVKGKTVYLSLLMRWTGFEVQVSAISDS